MVFLHDNDNVFRFAFLQRKRNNAHSHGSVKPTKKRCIIHAWPVVGDVCLRRPIDKTHNMHVHDVIIFTNLHFCSLHGDNKSSIFKNVHFETRFQEFTFSGRQNAIVV